MVDNGRIGRHKHTIHGLLDIDITETRRLIRAYRARTGQPLALTTFVLACLGNAVAADTTVHAYRTWRGHLVLFDDVDITTIIESELEGHKFPFAYIVRAANTKTPGQIQQELRAVQQQPMQHVNLQKQKFMELFTRLPTFARNVVYGVVLRNPHMRKQQTGTVMLTAVGMFGGGGGWGIGVPTHTLAVTLGGIAAKPGVVRGEVAVREYLSTTISFDHDIVDGAPAARFTRRFKALVESGAGIDKQQPDTDAT